jgi:hypothetical protein
MNENTEIRVVEDVEDVEGHGAPAPETLAKLVRDEVDDVTGHVQPRRDLDIER